MKHYLGNIEDETIKNETFRTTLFTGKHLQLTVMDIKPGEDVGLEVHPHVDQFLRAEAGSGTVLLGESEDTMKEVGELKADMALIIPAGTWHNVVNSGSESLKLYSIYAPPNHPEGTIHRTKADAEAAEAAEHGDQ